MAYGPLVSTDRSKAVPLLQFFFVSSSVVSYVVLCPYLFLIPLFLWCIATYVSSQAVRALSRGDI